MVKVYKLPEELPVPGFSMDFAEMERAENAHREALKAHLIALGYTGKHTGKEYRTHVADGDAYYMLADSGRGLALIHLPYGDGYQSRDVEFLPRKVILERVAQQERFNALFAKGA